MPDRRLLVVYGVVAAAVGVGAFWFATRVRMERTERRDFVKHYRQMISTRTAVANEAAQSEREDEAQAVVKVIFGSESGNAEALAKGLVQALQDHSVPSVLIDPSAWSTFDRYVNNSSGRHGATAAGQSTLFAPTRGSGAATPIVYVFVTATTGEGQAPANMLMLQAEMASAVAEHEARVKRNTGGSESTVTPPFKDVHYAVFALGDTSYKYFCKCGTTLNTLLRKGGGTEVYKVGFGDAKKKRQEDDFDEWAEQFMAALTSKCGITLTAGSMDPPAPNLTLRYLTPLSDDTAVTHAETLDTVAAVPAVVASPSPFPAPPSLMEPSLAFPVPLKILSKTAVTAPRESDKSYVLRMVVSTAYDSRPRQNKATGSVAAGSGAPSVPILQYQAGDHFGVLACNPPDAVSRFAALFSLSEEQMRSPVELCVCSRSAVRTVWQNTLPACVPLRIALERYVDLCGRPRRSALRVLAKYCSSATEREAFLKALCRGADAEVTESPVFRTMLDYVEAYPSCAASIPLGHVLELLGRLQPRYYSIASDPLSHGDTLQVYIRVVKGGLASQYLSCRVDEGDFIFGFVRPSTFHLPTNIADGRPVIMIGPGTGVAAMIGLNYRREAMMWRKANARYGPCLFYFGAQHRASEFFVEETVQRWASTPTEVDAFDAAHPDSEAGLAARRQRPNKRTHLPISVITDLQLAFSRDQAEKIYVTHLMEQQLDTLYALLTSTAGGGCLVYVSGDAAAMAKEVDRVLARALQEKGKLSRLAALEFLRTMEQERRLLKDVY